MQAIHIQGSTNNDKSSIFKALRRYQKCSLKDPKIMSNFLTYILAMENTQLHKKVYITRLQPNQLWLNSPLTVVGSNPGNYPWLLYLKALMRGQRNDFQQKNDWQLFILWENHGSLKSVMSESTNRIKIPAKWDILSLYPTGKMFYEIMFQHIRMEYAYKIIED